MLVDPAIIVSAISLAGTLVLIVANRRKTDSERRNHDATTYQKLVETVAKLNDELEDERAARKRDMHELQQELHQRMKTQQETLFVAIGYIKALRATIVAMGASLPPEPSELTDWLKGKK